MTKNIENRVEIVNRLLEEAFGEGTQGNLICGHSTVNDMGEKHYLDYEKLRLIVENGLFGKKKIGHFNPPYNGSSLTLNGEGLFWRNRIGAKIYGDLYKRRFGEEVKIKVDNNNIKKRFFNYFKPGL
tara:strand:- start:583 stop:963 length:381 start_codon:yes stop_codon:yes gene_type:complete